MSCNKTNGGGGGGGGGGVGGDAGSGTNTGTTSSSSTITNSASSTTSAGSATSASSTTSSTGGASSTTSSTAGSTASTTTSAQPPPPPGKRKKRQAQPAPDGDGPKDLSKSGAIPDAIAKENEFMRKYMGLGGPERMIIGHQFDNFVQMCTFRGRDCKNISNFLQVASPAYGNCFTFNSLQNDADEYAGERYTSMTGM